MLKGEHLLSPVPQCKYKVHCTPGPTQYFHASSQSMPQSPDESTLLLLLLSPKEI